MDFTQAALLISAVFAVTRLVDLAVPQAKGATLQLIAVIVGIATTFLVAYSSYANTVTIGNLTLDKVNTAGLVLIGLLISGGATVVNEGYKAIKNVGDNQPNP